MIVLLFLQLSSITIVDPEHRDFKEKYEVGSKSTLDSTRSTTHFFLQKLLQHLLVANALRAHIN